jgi:hypothetical protein
MKIRRRGIKWSCEHFPFVMAGLVPAIHVFGTAEKTWMPGTRQGMTTEVLSYSSARLAALENFLFTRSRFSFDR